MVFSGEPDELSSQLQQSSKSNNSYYNNISTAAISMTTDCAVVNSVSDTNTPRRSAAAVSSLLPTPSNHNTSSSAVPGQQDDTAGCDYQHAVSSTTNMAAMSSQSVPGGSGGMPSAGGPIGAPLPSRSSDISTSNSVINSSSSGEPVGQLLSAATVTLSCGCNCAGVNFNSRPCSSHPRNPI